MSTKSATPLEQLHWTDPTIIQLANVIPATSEQVTLQHDQLWQSIRGETHSGPKNLDEEQIWRLGYLVGEFVDKSGQSDKVSPVVRQIKAVQWIGRRAIKVNDAPTLENSIQYLMNPLIAATHPIRSAIAHSSLRVIAVYNSLLSKN